MPTKIRKRPRGKAPRGDGRVMDVMYSPAVAREICERIAAGEAWGAICNTGRLPAVATLYNWRRRYPVFAEALAQAREIARQGSDEIPDIFERLEDPMTNDDDDSDLPAKSRWPGGVRPRDENGARERVVYSRAVSDRICARLAAGERWSQFCGTEGYPTWTALHQWRRSRPEFDAAVRAARRLAAEACIDEARAVAAATTPETLACDKVKIDTCFKSAAFLDRVQFGPGRPRHEDGGEPPLRRIVIRHFENTFDENGREYLRAVDQVQVIE